MREHRSRTPILWMILTTTLVVAGVMFASWAHAQDSPPTKGPDAITVGTGPYTGPTPAELAKKAAQDAAAPALSEAKMPEAQVIHQDAGAPVLTQGELAKLAELEAYLRSLPGPVMRKVPEMVLPKTGNQELTAQEKTKLAKERAQESATGASEKGPDIVTVGSPDATAPSPEEIAKMKAIDDPTAPQPAPRTDR